MTQHFIPDGFLKEVSEVCLRTDTGAIVSEVGSLIAFEDGTFEISLRVQPMSGSALEFELPCASATSGKRPLAALIDGQRETVRVEVGEVIIAEQKCQATFFAHAGLDARYVF